MFKLLIAQFKRLFSSAKNGAKLVNNLTDRLHYYKQVLLATSLVILLGYSQFREHFKCQGAKQVDPKVLTTFCWINGTYTLAARDLPAAAAEQPYATGASEQLDARALRQSQTSAHLRDLVPHVGLHFQSNDDRYELINHNYMRSLWALLILMAFCSFFAQRYWSLIFSQDLLRALLQLPGHKDLSVVRKAQEARPYELLIKSNARKRAQQTGRDAQIAQLFKGSPLHETIEILIGDENEHNHSLDYYPNQLIYFLLSKRSISASKLPALALKRKLILHSLCSTCMTVMQLVLPLVFIGDRYLLYGWLYAEALLAYMMSGDKQSVNSVDYQLSARIWPTSTSCEYKQFGLRGLEVINVQCSVPINEISAKLFAVIWWFVAVNIVIELGSLLIILTSSLHSDMTKSIFAFRFWPKAGQQAQLIASFRYRHAQLLDKQLQAINRRQRFLLAAETTNLAHGLVPLKDANSRRVKLEPIESNQLDYKSSNEREKKKLEAEGDRIGSSSSLGSKKWFPQREGDLAKGKRLSGDHKLARRAGELADDNEEGLRMRELREDSSIYYLLYLLYLRLDKSAAKMEQVIRMTSTALSNYLDSLESLEEEKLLLLESEACEGQQVGCKSASSSPTSNSSLSDDEASQESSGSTIVNVRVAKQRDESK